MFNQNCNDPMAYQSLSHGLRRLWVSEGINGYYRGVIPGLVGTLHGAIQFVIYEKLKSVRKSSIQSNHLNTSDVLITSSISKVLATIITYPYQVVRSRLQIQTLDNGILKILHECIR
jgi:solute carrier family 25 folate transporter 32